jgi:hypothetical protein
MPIIRKKKSNNERGGSCSVDRADNKWRKNIVAKPEINISKTETTMKLKY